MTPNIINNTLQKLNAKKGKVATLLKEACLNIYKNCVLTTIILRYETIIVLSMKNINIL